MSDIFTPFEKRKLTAKNKALLEEWKEIHELCQVRNDIAYTIAEKNKNDLPIKYEITYRIPSFVDLDKNKKIDYEKLDNIIENEKFLFFPEFGDIHRLQIIIPPSFPQINGKPKGSIKTKIWHPNIVCHGDENIVGRVCFNEGNLDASVTIADRILQVADYLTYKNYLAEDREPYPYDLDVAYWIREVAEPMAWVIPEYGINYEKFGLKITEPKAPQKVETKPEIQVDDDIIILDDDDYEFPMDIVENNIEDDKNEQDEIYEI
ncbi:MAG: hypothetical protein HQ541_10335 [Mariniphaga sp.]|nr:hypothetical protein [Mariniphaga sp.]